MTTFYSKEALLKAFELHNILHAEHGGPFFYVKEESVEVIGANQTSTAAIAVYVSLEYHRGEPVLLNKNEYGKDIMENGELIAHYVFKRSRNPLEISAAFEACYAEMQAKMVLDKLMIKGGYFKSGVARKNRVIKPAPAPEPRAPRPWSSVPPRLKPGMVRIGSITSHGPVIEINSKEFYVQTQSGERLHSDAPGLTAKPLSRGILKALGFQERVDIGAVNMYSQSGVTLLERGEGAYEILGQPGAFPTVKYAHQLQEVMLLLRGVRLNWSAIKPEL